MNYSDHVVIPLDSVNKIDLKDSPHILIAGKTGFGKTSLMKWLILGFMSQKYGNGGNVYIIDNKRSQLYAWRRILNNGNKSVVASADKAAKLLRLMAESMNHRCFDNVPYLNDGYSIYHFRPVLIVIDELTSLLAEKPKISDEINDHLTQLIMKGREAQIYLLVGLQRPESKAIDTNIRAQFNTRIFLGPSSSDELKIIFPMVTNRNRPIYPAGRGEGLIFLENQGWQLPRPCKAPDIRKIDIPRAITTIQSQPDYCDFLTEPYWQD